MPESPAVHPVPTTDGGFTPAQVAAAVEHGREMIRVGSKSFSLASKLLPRGAREGAWLLYAWCRHCDDEIDEAPTREERARRLADLRRRTELAYRDELTAEERAELLAHPIFVAFRQVARSCGIPRFYALELLEGMAMDLNHRPYGDERELRLYCYRVAGVVGLMMSHVMGLSDERALRHASDLGSAMQLTNIARDVLDDAAGARPRRPGLGHAHGRLDGAKAGARAARGVGVAHASGVSRAFGLGARGDPRRARAGGLRDLVPVVSLRAPSGRREAKGIGYLDRSNQGLAYRQSGTG
jgi:phytoene synthase